MSKPACTCPTCAASQPRAATAAESRLMSGTGWTLTQTRRWNHTMRDPELRAYALGLLNARGGAPEPADLKLAIDARHASTTSKNIQGRLGPEPSFPSRPAASPHVDRMVGDVMSTGPDRTVASPASTELKTAI